MQIEICERLNGKQPPVKGSTPPFNQEGKFIHLPYFIDT